MDTPAPPASPPSRKESGKSKECPLSTRSERAENEAVAGEKNPITCASKKGRRRRSSIGQGQYSEALVGASQGLDALRAGDEDVPPEPPFLADSRHAQALGGAAVGSAPMEAEPTTVPVRQEAPPPVPMAPESDSSEDAPLAEAAETAEAPVPQLQGTTRDERGRSLWRALGCSNAGGLVEEQ